MTHSERLTFKTTLEKAIDRELCFKCIPWAKCQIELLDVSKDNYLDKFDLDMMRNYAMDLDKDNKKLEKQVDELKILLRQARANLPLDNPMRKVIKEYLKE